jgi:putative transferase (TIGR04331 family)
MQKRLVLTALEETWGDSESLLFLGEWCKLYERRHIWGDRTYETVSFHWDDRGKLAKDYDYLESLHHRLLDSLAASLNDLHGLNYSVRYWQILLDPWLLTYVSTLFDRWEALRITFEKENQFESIFFENSTAGSPPFSYSEFIHQVLSDEWNQAICQRIIEREYSDKCLVKAVNTSKSNVIKKNAIALNKTSGSLLGKLSLMIDDFLGRCVSKYDVVFFMSNFNLPALIRLNLGIKQIPRLFLSEFRLTNELKVLLFSGPDVSVRKRVKFKFKPESKFENFIKQFIIQDLPSSLIEGFAPIVQRVKQIPIKTKAIVTASAHWNNIVAKFWFAEQVSQGTKLVVLEHGGSFPAPKELFDFDEDISDIKGTWFSPYHEKHIQVPPSKLVKANRPLSVFSKKKDRHQYCAVIGSECSRWVYRCHFYPMGAQCLTSFDLTIQLYKHLDETVKKYFKVKPYPDQGINTIQRYKDSLGAHHVFSEKNIARVFEYSKIIVCTYPETTFSEAMMSGIPTIMLYPKEFYERHVLAEPLLDILRKAHIIFHDFQSAATHINKIWDDPISWWCSEPVLRAREEFKAQASNLDKNCWKDWKHFTKRIQTIETYH